MRAVGVRLRAHKCVLNVWPRVEFPNLATSIDLSHMSFGCLYLLVFVCVARSLSLCVCMFACVFSVSLMIYTSAHLCHERRMPPVRVQRVTQSQRQSLQSFAEPKKMTEPWLRPSIRNVREIVSGKEGNLSDPPNEAPYQLPIVSTCLY